MKGVVALATALIFRQMKKAKKQIEEKDFFAYNKGSRKMIEFI